MLLLFTNNSNNKKYLINSLSFSQRQFNADLYHSSISIAAKTTPRSQSKDISHAKKHYVTTLFVESKFYRVGRDSFLTSRF